MSIATVLVIGKRKLSDTISMTPVPVPLHQHGAKKYKTGGETDNCTSPSIPNINLERKELNFEIVTGDIEEKEDFECDEGELSIDI